MPRAWPFLCPTEARRHVAVFIQALTCRVQLPSWAAVEAHPANSCIQSCRHSFRGRTMGIRDMGKCNGRKKGDKYGLILISDPIDPIFFIDPITHLDFKYFNTNIVEKSLQQFFLLLILLTPYPTCRYIPVFSEFWHNATLLSQSITINSRPE